MSFTQEDLDKLLDLPGNEYLKKSAEDKYKDFCNCDPFPNIDSALLNHNDILRYVLTVGLIDEKSFKVEKLVGATYTCNFSGSYTYWDNKHEQCMKNNMIEDEELVLQPNSITFLEIDTFFRIPEYMVLRFNLQVQNVYKGLLLGTGPIVDPCFIGKLHIPLHNLTSNEYKIKTKATLIAVEFTKLSTNNRWDIPNNSHLKSVLTGLRFCNINYNSRKFETRGIDDYINKALFENSKFRKSNNAKFINSSMQELSKKVDDGIRKNEQITSNSIKETKDTTTKFEEKIKTFEIIGIIGIIVAVIGMLLPTWNMLKDIGKERNDYAEKQMELESKIHIIERDLNINLEKIDSLNNSIKSLQDSLILEQKLMKNSDNKLGEKIQ